jgi:hypothetical protein
MKIRGAIAETGLRITHLTRYAVEIVTTEIDRRFYELDEQGN